ncbi:CsiV family protein [Halopseudomonas pelagia]|uniref:CsiV family protein n=1 Tax=Halopseudomonas pelagia TaxID=553151 RepID=UPI0003A0058A|nr:CsiV family protein [Halopseudomonas pelagia]|tara:strand:+ start:37022 stop:37579 length:558 start_codon:yes stop_codon:yes gene_type:complete
MISLRSLQLLALLTLCGWMGLAQAQSQNNYQVELVIFSQPSAQLTPGTAPSYGWADQATKLGETTRSDVRILDSSRHRLSSDAGKLSAQGYKVVLHQAWTQPDDNNLVIAVHEGQEMDGVYPVQALISLGRERLLEVDITAWINNQTQERELVSERIKQIRRLRLNETHYLDHQSMGMLIRISRN